VSYFSETLCYIYSEDILNEFLQKFFDLRISDFVHRRLIREVFVINVSSFCDQKTSDCKPRHWDIWSRSKLIVYLASKQKFPKYWYRKGRLFVAFKSASR